MTLAQRVHRTLAKRVPSTTDPCQKGQGPLPKGFTAPQTLAKRVKDPCQKGSQHHRPLPKGFTGPLPKGFTGPLPHRSPCQKGQRPLPKGPRTLAKRVMKPLTKRQCTAFLDKREEHPCQKGKVSEPCTVFWFFNP